MDENLKFYVNYLPPDIRPNSSVSHANKEVHLHIQEEV